MCKQLCHCNTQRGVCIYCHANIIKIRFPVKGGWIRVFRIEGLELTEKKTDIDLDLIRIVGSLKNAS